MQDGVLRNAALRHSVVYENQPDVVSRVVRLLCEVSFGKPAAGP